MGYHDEVREKIMSEGMGKSPAYAKKKLDGYQKSAEYQIQIVQNQDIAYIAKYSDSEHTAPPYLMNNPS